jgi:septal ring factor EnvC (AmiA/AmiB activator)
MRTTAATSTRKLATARLEFRGDRRFTQAVQLAAVAALLMLAILIGRQLHADSDGAGAVLAALRQQNAALQADLARTRTELGLERSTRAALARQVAELNQKSIALQSRLEFFNAQSGQPAPRR